MRSHAAVLYAGAVLECGHGRDLCVEASTLRHPAPLSSASLRFHRAEPVPRRHLNMTISASQVPVAVAVTG